ncbi:VWFA-related domain-containing protein [Granulicella rosea]|uniref:VWFA-related domain-containing protein n=1 Tax=Granulicella rosea TaxID=474952 RepID=A0A239LIG4_9BACT|nr:VWA domain-containing protein [Granulicella rosea]SNT30467.1 VWFA-related domain-containing protein [Granulicella rosea]
MTIRLLCLAALALLAPQSPHAQQPASPAPAAAAPSAPAETAANTIRSTARLVVLDMVVVDAKGNSVPDLKREDFHVTEADETQTVQNFEMPGTRAVGDDLAINSTAELDRLAPRAPVNIILLDEFNTRFEDMAFARYSLKKYLTKKESDKLSTPTMLIAVSIDNFTVLQDYTQSRAAILNALDHHFAALPWRTQQNQWLAERYATAFNTLRRVAQAVVGHPGHKNMIWVGRGFPSLNYAHATVDSENRIFTAVQDCVDKLRDARVTLYTIDPAGISANVDAYGGDAELVDPFGGNYEFAKLAKATGGRTLYGRNDVDAEIGTAIRDGASFYTLTYRPTSESYDPRKFRKIVVTVDRPGLKVITREGYYPQGPPVRVNAEKPATRLVSDLMLANNSTMVYDGVPITVKPSPSEPGAFHIHVDARALNWSAATDDKPRGAEIILMVSTFDKKGKEIKHDANVLRVTAPRSDPPTGRLERPVELPYKLPHDDKAVRVRFVVRVSSTGRIGTIDLPLVAAKP